MTTIDRTSDDRTTSIEIPARIAEQIGERIADTEFDSVEEYVTVALEQTLRELDRMDEREGRPDPADTESVDDSGPEEAVEDRLDSLGYL